MKTNFLHFKKSWVTLLISSLVIGISNNVKANHFVGGDISYQCTNTAGVYKVQIKFYGDCGGVALCSGCSLAIPNGTVASCNTSNAGINTTIIGASGVNLGVNFGSFILNSVAATSGFDIVQTCSSVKTVCTNCNTRTAGTFSPGIEVYVFEGSVDLSSLPSNCCKVTLSANGCCRNWLLTTIVPANFAIVCELDRCQTACNSAPTFTNEAIALVCAGQDFVYNLGANDPDGDSLSYAFGQALQDIGTPVSYVAPYSSLYPFPYFGSPNANAALPAGLHIDPITGDIMFRPMGTFVSNLVIEVKQWKLVAGVWVNVGLTRRDIQFQSIICTTNKAPTIKVYRNNALQTGKLNFNAVAGVPICLDFVAQDQEDLTTTPPILADTTDLKWNNSGLYFPIMDNATFSPNYILNQRGMNGPKADSFKFCWTPPINAIRTLPYLFTVSGGDRFCPLRAAFTRGVSITVEAPKIVINETTKNVFCNNRNTTFNLNYSANGVNLLSSNVFTVQLSDSFGSFINNTIIGTTSNTNNSGTILATLPSGLILNKSYKLRLLSSSDINVETVPYDLTLVQGYIQPIITANQDTICFGSNAAISLNSSANIVDYKWFLNNQIINAANSNNIIANINGTYKVLVSNTGCSDTSNAKTITVNLKPIANFTINNAAQCLIGNNFSFTNTSTNSNVQTWNFGDTTYSNLLSPSKTYNNVGIFTIKLVAKSTMNCTDSLSKTINVNPQSIIGSITGNTATTSITTPYTYSVLNQANVSYNWSATNGNIQSGQGTNVVSVVWTSAGGGSINAKITNASNCVDSTNLAVNNSVGLKELNFNTLSSIKFKPNPFTNELEASFISTNKETTKLLIIDAVGKEIYVKSIQSNIGNNTIIIDELANLKTGIYFASLTNKNGLSQSFKLVKE